MKKKMAKIVILAAIAGIMVFAGILASQPPATLLGWVDLSNAYVSPDVNGGAMGMNGYCWSFNDENPGNWGGEFGQGAVTAFPGDSDDAGYCMFQAFSDKAHRIELRVLDGIADDSFDVYVKNPADKWVLVYSYMDQYTTETWLIHNIYSFPAGKGQGSTVEIKIMPTNVGWSGFNTWGQLGVDYIKLYDH